MHFRVSLPFLSSVLLSSRAMTRLGFLVLLLADAFKDGQTTLAGHSKVECAHIWLSDLINSGLHDGCVLAKQVLVASPL